jgi:CRP/FNR family transcriptional regulator, cyclic AMP receptor protein
MSLRRSRRMQSSSRLDHLRRIPGLRGARVRELREVSRLIDRAQVDAGDLLTAEGSWNREAFVVIEGHAEVLSGGRRVGTVGPGEFVGEVGMIDHGPHTTTVRATTPMRVFVIGPQAFGCLLSYGRVGHVLLERMSSRLRTAESPGSGQLIALPTSATRSDRIAEGHRLGA